MNLVVRPWYREPMVWLMLAIPLATVVAGLVTLSLAMQDGATDVAPQRVVRTAQAQVSDLGPDIAAATRKLQGHRAIGADGTRITVRLPGVAAEEGPLRLDLVHPIRAREDRHIVLDWRDGQWQAQAAWPAGRWRLSLVDRQSRWRLAGQAQENTVAEQLDVSLQSAMAPR